MASDAHSHPFDLSLLHDGAEAERARLNIVCAASAWRAEDFQYNERAAARFPMALCFAVHPQLPAACAADEYGPETVRDSLSLLHELAAGKRLDAVGETGFDLFDSAFRATEEAQEALFLEQLRVAEEYGLPLVLHIRRAIGKMFRYGDRLKSKIPSVVFHSYSGTADEAASLLRRGINAYFSFGTAILLNHKRAIGTCAALDEGRLLFETDAPYQGLRGKAFSSHADIRPIIAEAAALRNGAGKSCSKDALEKASDENFYRVFGKRLP
ncbi:MAG: TatD family hydrolase [Spirochaetaceae bacterium]|jgi:TatD DNase family protein|nr:TatD family hydrolase [Spirochaetaceae bacterium]